MATAPQLARRCVSSAAVTPGPGRCAGLHRACQVPRPRVVPRAFASQQPDASTAPGALEGRHMALPNNAMWLLDFMQDKFYDVRGPNFVLQRAESEDDGSAPRRRNKARKLTKVQPGSSSAASLSLINRVVHQHPGSIMLLEGGVVDVSDWMEPYGDDLLQTDELLAASTTGMPANTTCTGIVRVEQEEEAEPAVADDVFFNGSTSPRRTKMIGFTCKCCGARTYSSINPRAFHEGTLVAQCAKCERWHKLADHFGLFHELQGPLLRGCPLVELDDVPPSLRLRDEEDGADMRWW